MVVFISADVENREEPVKIKFSTENLNNLNYVNMVIGNREFTVGIVELESAVKAFMNERKHYQE